MEGPSNPDEQTQGMIPRALTQVFAAAQELAHKGWTVSSLFAHVPVYTYMYMYIFVYLI